MRRLLSLVCAILSWPSIVLAQPPTTATVEPRYFIEAGALAAHAVRYFQDGDGWRPGIELAAGGFLSPRRSLRVEADLPMVARDELVRDYFSYDPAVREVVLRPVRTRTADAVEIVAGFYGVHVGSRRLRLALLAGGGHAFWLTAITNATLSGEPINGHEELRLQDQATVLSLGADLEAPLAPRLSLVLQARLHASAIPQYLFEYRFPRASAGLRWAF